MTAALLAVALAPFSAAEIRADLDLLDRALDALHPGVTLHQTVDQYEASRVRLRARLSRGADLRTAYVALSEHLAGVRCGHTYANFWNQTDENAAVLFGRRDKLPMTFRIVEGRMLVTAADGVPVGGEVLKIDGRPVRSILARLLRVTKGDGTNDENRLAQLQVSGLGSFEPFDSYFPLVFPPDGGRYEVTYLRPGPFSRPESTSVLATTREERRRRFQLIEAAPWDATILPGGIGHLRLTSFTTWNFGFDWRKFLDSAFQRFRDESPENLVIDLRGNEGGDDSVIAALAAKLAKRDVQWTERPLFARYVKVPDDLRPHLETWNPAVFDLTGDAGDPRPDGLRPLKSRPGGTKTFRAQPGAYPGKVWLLVGPSNSSATFYTARLFQETGLATLVGRTTGGSQRGMQGGQFLLLRLPNTGIEVDIPLLAGRPEPAGPDRGLEPDVPVKWRFQAVQRGIDPDMEAVRRLIRDVR